MIGDDFVLIDMPIVFRLDYNANEISEAQFTADSTPWAQKLHKIVHLIGTGWELTFSNGRCSDRSDEMKLNYSKRGDLMGWFLYYSQSSILQNIREHFRLLQAESLRRDYAHCWMLDPKSMEDLLSFIRVTGLCFRSAVRVVE
jgi:hypothetical protein